MISWEVASATAAIAAASSAVIALFIALYKRKPHISVRWKQNEWCMGVDFVNTGDRPAERFKAIFDLSDIRNSPNDYQIILKEDESPVLTLLPGENYAVTIATVVQVGKWAQDSNIAGELFIEAQWRYKTWLFGRNKIDTQRWVDTLQWDDYYGSLIEGTSGESKIINSLQKISKNTENVNDRLKEIGNNLCQHTFYHSKERVAFRIDNPNILSQELLCDGCHKLFPYDRPEVQTWIDSGGYFYEYE